MDLKKFDPVWISGIGYPGEIPEEIKDMLYGDKPSPQIDGSIRTISWLCGFEDLVTGVDDLGYVLKDEVMTIPGGSWPAMFILDLLWLDRQIPLEAYKDVIRYLLSVLELGSDGRRDISTALTALTSSILASIHDFREFEKCG
ncbi:hypothetical protein FQN52_004798 [Onygenales sp. PD_12]|nr:hypothetical protein FQN52_004798 [Onygenales sp. PD_12]